MSKGTRLFLVIVLGGVVLCLATVGAAVAAVYQAGTIAVEVEEQDGSRFNVGVPAGLARVAIALAPDSILDEVSTELGPWAPAVRAGWDELESIPDCVLVEVVSGDEHVTIEKSGSTLLVHVEADGMNLRVGVPMGTVGAILNRFDG